MSIYASSVLNNVSSQQLRLSFNIGDVDSLLPFLCLGDFAVFCGSSAVRSLINLLCVRTQLPIQLGGLESNVLFVDGGNSFRLYDISSIAQSMELDPRTVLERIFISRTFTAYQMVDLVFEQLEAAVKKYDTKVVVIANLAQQFLDKDVPPKEAKEIFLQLTKYLQDFTKNNNVILVATHPPFFWSKHRRFFTEVLCSRANIVSSIKKFRKRPYFILEKHPVFKTGKVELSTNETTLTDYSKPHSMQKVLAEGEP
jgi:hypothetical protein